MLGSSLWRGARIRFISTALVLAVLAFCFGTGCENVPLMEPRPGIVCRWDFESSADGTGLPCSVYLPAGYNPALAYPLWVELHALYAKPIIENDPNNPFSNEMKNVADSRQIIIVAPWGRNLHSMYVDGAKKQDEPDIFDDFAGGAPLWQPAGGAWTAGGGVYRQTDTSASWKESVRSGSTGKDYAARVRFRDLSPPGTETAVGVNLRRGSAGDLYHLDLYRDRAGARFVRLFKAAGGAWQELFRFPYEWKPLNALDGWIDLKFSCYQGYLEVYINEEIINMQPAYDATPYGYGRKAPADPLPAGEMSLCCFGGPFEFDDVRLQSEYRYGERDVIDSVLGTMEKYTVDPSRVYLAGHSQGGLGAFTAALHYPDMFAASRPADGLTDIHYDYRWLQTFYPPNPGGIYADVNDGQLCDYIREIAGGEPGPSFPERLSVLNGSSARYILENAVNGNFRIVHGTPDSNIPNSHDPVPVSWWAPWWIFWIQYPAPAPYNPATATYRNGKDIADLLASWSQAGGYSSEYLTHPYLGHGYMDAYGDTAAYFLQKTADRRPLEVAYKTYDDANTGAWWLSLRIPEPGSNRPGMARVVADPPANSAAIHARNLTWLQLDVARMGLNNGAGKTLTFAVDDDTAPNVFPIEDSTGRFELVLNGTWPVSSGYSVALDGAPLQAGVDYALSPTSITVNSVPAPGGHTLTVSSPEALPANLAPNPGLESEGPAGKPLGWSGSLSGDAAAGFSWEDLEARTGARSLRVKDPVMAGGGTSALWRSDPVAVSGGVTLNATCYAKARMFRAEYLGLGIEWYGPGGTLIGVTLSENLRNGTYATNLDWTPLVASGPAPAGCAYARLIAGAAGYSPGSPSGSAWFDDFTCN